MKYLIALFLITASLNAASLTLTWTDNSNNEAGFAIERSPGTGAPTWVEIARVGPNVTSYKDEGLAPSTAFSYRLRAFNAGGYSGYAGPVTGTTLIAPPNAPSDPNTKPDDPVVTVSIGISVAPGVRVATTTTRTP